MESDVEAGTSKVMYSDTLYTFTKKRNADSVQVSAKDLATQLATLGVEKDIIDKAMEKANKVRRGNTYYNVSET
jgi:SOS response regulatory protein OraA/RecX